VAEVITLEPNDTRRLANLCGQFDAHLRQIESRLNVEIRTRGNQFSLHGTADSTDTAGRLLQQLYTDTRDGHDLTPDDVHLALAGVNTGAAVAGEPGEQLTLIRTKKCTVKPRGQNQQKYVRLIQTHDINFGIGPAGTGKTYLAVACAVEALLKDEVERILLVRPAVEAGEKLGFLPGDLSRKWTPTCARSTTHSTK
jgi:phosphate starvation-inducible PhoH-like protein